MISHTNQCLVDAYDAPPVADIAHITGALATAEVRPEPFPHAVIENFLPDDLATALRAEAETGTGPGWIGDHTRASLYLTQSVGTPDGETAAGRRAVGALSARPTIDAVRALFDGHLDRGTSVDRLVVGLELMRDRVGFMLPPHTDGERRMIGCLVYLADPGDPEELGTRLYAPRDASLVESARNSVNYEDVDEVVTAPFRRNLALIWVRSNRSFHGVPPGIVDRDRRALQWCVERY